MPRVGRHRTFLHARGKLRRCSQGAYHHQLRSVAPLRQSFRCSCCVHLTLLMPPPLDRAAERVRICAAQSVFLLCPSAALSIAGTQETATRLIGLPRSWCAFRPIREQSRQTRSLSIPQAATRRCACSQALSQGHALPHRSSEWNAARIISLIGLASAESANVRRDQLVSVPP
jgi:hypothetical protein